MEVSWSWTAPRAVTVKEQAYAVRPEVNLARVAQFQADLLVAAHVQATLASAADAFSAGTAEYHDATRKLQNLYLELSRAEASLDEVARTFGAFFEPAGLAAAFEGDVEAYYRFVKEACAKLATPPLPESPKQD